MSTVRRVAWLGPDPDRVDAAFVELDDDRLRARGTSAAEGWTVAWSLDTGPGWVTRELRVHVAEPGVERSLLLRRDDAGGGWWAERAEHPPGEPGPATPLALDGLATAVDCDLGLCPLTNTMPVLRHQLLQPGAAPADLVMAWVSVPELEVHASPQHYSPDGAGAVRFVSEDFTARIELDEDGLVVDYPGIAERLQPLDRV